MMHTAATQFQYYPECRDLIFTRRVQLQAPGDSGVVRERLMDPTHCSCTKARKVSSSPNSMHISQLFLQYKQDYNVGWFWDCQVWGGVAPPQGHSACCSDVGIKKAMIDYEKKDKFFM